MATWIDLDNGTAIPLTEFRRNEDEYRKAAGPNAYQYDDREPSQRTNGLPEPLQQSKSDKKTDD